MQNEFWDKFQNYLSEWEKLDSFRLNWWLKNILYLPFGFILEVRNLRKKHKLTKEYGEYLSKLT